MFCFAQHDKRLFSKNRSRLLWFVCNFENNFAARMARSDLFLGFRCFRKR
jgi:hypothetical protein